jgi:protein subunit release factor A
VAVVLPASRVSLPVQASPEPVVVTKLTPPAVIKVEEKPAEKIIEVLQVDEGELEAELEEIRQKAEFAKKVEAQQQQHKPVLLFDEEPEIPTLASREVNEVNTGKQLSLNEQLGEFKTEVAHKLNEGSSIKDLKKAIGINDRFVFINELFRGDEVMYERSIKTINNFSIYPEAQYWMERELKIKLGWDNDRPATQEFYSLVKRRFS